MIFVITLTRLQTSLFSGNMKIKTLIANPEGLIEGQTKIVKGGGSSLLNYMLQRFKANNVKRVQRLRG
jgi:CRISPR/Cas system-associated endoribonuclease Cas2